jgi:CheY-like chemotaxis protein
LTVVAAALENRGHDVIERSTAIGTTVAILQEKPDVVILDVRMPGLSGDRLAALIGQEGRFRPIVVFYSSLPDDYLATLVRSSGAAGFVPKGVGAAAFVNMFDDIVATAQRNLARKRAKSLP